jgi:succinyl-CoA synthetase beta subunit
MKVHEYQARQMFAARGVPVPPGEIATTSAEAVEIATRFNKPVMVKAQVLVGGRGKAGGVKYAENAEAAHVLATKILGMDIKGETVRKVLISEAVDILSESYVGIVLDRAAQKPLIMVSSAGGVDIEEVAAKTPEKIHKLHVDPVYGLQLHEARELAYKLFKDVGQVRKAADILMKLYQTFWEVDASLVEINPLVTVNIDDNGLFRHPEIAAMRDLDAENPAEAKAREADLSFVKLEGSIGCIVNGAGLAMATMDLVKRYGGEPANFLDIGGSSNPQKVVTAMQIILSDPNVRAILINIFGGITRCDDVANGIVEAFRQLQPSIPVVVRLTGTNEKEAKRILASVKLPSAGTLDGVVKKAIELAGLAA